MVKSFASLTRTVWIQPKATCPAQALKDPLFQKASLDPSKLTALPVDVDPSSVYALDDCFPRERLGVGVMKLETGITSSKEMPIEGPVPVEDQSPSLEPAGNAQVVGQIDTPDGSKKVVQARKCDLFSVLSEWKPDHDLLAAKDIVKCADVSLNSFSAESIVKLCKWLLDKGIPASIIPGNCIKTVYPVYAKLHEQAANVPPAMLDAAFLEMCAEKYGLRYESQASLFQDDASVDKQTLKNLGKTLGQHLKRTSFDGTFNAMWVADTMTKHLIATAKPQNMPAAPVMRLNINIPALIAQKPKIGNCGL